MTKVDLSAQLKQIGRRLAQPGRPALRGRPVPRCNRGDEIDACRHLRRLRTRHVPPGDIAWLTPADQAMALED